MLRALLRKGRDPIVILPYPGYGTRRRLVVCGRVLQDEGIRVAAATDRRWRNLAAFLKRLESDEVRGAVVCAGKAEAKTDREGYFRLELPGGRPGWNEIALRLAGDAAVRAVARVLVPAAKARFGVISDIDDTILQTHVTSRLKMLLTVALTNARTRKPFAGAAAFYRALHGGVNPFFYVSKSPWNLYPLLAEFFRLQNLPDGPLLLRDLSLRMEKQHKEKRIEAILAAYPKLPFVLIGDSGEKDPEIYAAVVRRYPKRILAVYIRSVGADPRRASAIERLIEEIAKTGCQLVFSPDTFAAATHAAGQGLIQPSDVRAVRKDCLSDASIVSKAAASTGALK
jgi:phosphatidate phosphatase APP1